MNTTIEVATKKPGTERLLACARAYELLARAFREPDPALVADLASGDFAGQLDGALAVLPFTVRLRRLAAQALEAVRGRADELESAYRARFVLAGAGGCPPYEAEYIPIGVFRRTQQMADVAGFYRAFGVEMAPATGRPDHLAAELEFMALLAFREAYARETGNGRGASVCRRAQRAFLGDHLARWLPAFSERLQAAEPAGPYGSLARVASEFVLRDARRQGVRPRPLDWALASGPSGEMPGCPAFEEGCPPPCLEGEP